MQAVTINGKCLISVKKCHASKTIYGQLSDISKYPELQEGIKMNVPIMETESKLDLLVFGEKNSFFGQSDIELTMVL